MKLATALGALGRILLTVGALTLLFVAYQLWGTGIHEARAQNELTSEFDEFLASEPEPVAASDSDEESAPPPIPEDGHAVARIEIPAIGVDKIVVQGVGVEDLKRGPGRFSSTPLPGQEGNAAIAGHRTTYGAPFHNIDKLVEGDEILVTTVEGEFRYEFTEQLIVSPNEVEVLDAHEDNRLTLVACHPKYSAAQRIIVTAELDESSQAALPASETALDEALELPSESSEAGADQNDSAAPDDETPPGDDAADSSEVTEGQAVSSLDGEAGLSGDRSGAWPAVLLALACAAIWLVAWLATRLVKPWMSYAAGTPIFLLALFFFFEEFSRFLPANF